MSLEQNNHSPALVIWGAGGHATSVASVALAAGYRVTHFIDANKTGSFLFGIPVIGDLHDYPSLDHCNISIAVGDNCIRQKIHATLTAKFPSLRYPALIHPSSTISAFSHVGDGTVVMPQAVVGANTNIGQFCIINTHASLDHDNNMHDFSSLAPAAVTGGKVHIGTRSYISIGAVIKNDLCIGNDCIVGANSYLNINLPDNQVAYGSPARIIRETNH